MTHNLEFDHRKKSLELTITGLSEVINELKNQLQQNSWYDGLWLIEETEPIIGIALVAFQNYINNSINDFRLNCLTDVMEYKLIYKEDSHIELIIHLANYYKHRNDNLNRNTEKGLMEYELLPLKEDQIENSPIFKGLEVLSPNWDLNEVSDIVLNWRANYLKSIILNN
jgi:hypothetical protein